MLAHRQNRLPLLFDPLAIETLTTDEQQKIWQIDAILPQTQCGLCGYREGCLPYAHAIITKGEQPNLCVPGGDDVARQIANMTNIPFAPAMPSKWATDPDTNRPVKMLAVIDEDACIGCTKCIPACPVDAIIGTAKHMHAIVPDLCTGCELCLPPCPVDCITLIPHNDNQISNNTYRQQYYAHLDRLARDVTDTQKPITSHTEAIISNAITAETVAISADVAQITVRQAKLRTQIKKLQKQLSLRDDPIKQAELGRLQEELEGLSNE